MTWQQSVGEQIMQARVKARLSKGRLAKQIGRSRKMIPRYESGSDAVSPELLAKIAIILGMDEININGYRFVIRLAENASKEPAAEQLVLDFGKEHVFEGATIRVIATKTTISITATAPSPPVRSAA